MEKTKIEWCVHTWNPWIGCTEVGPACDHCYARIMMADRYGRVRWGAGEDRVRTSPQNWLQPFKWDRAAAAAGRVDTVFCLSLGDIWDNEVDPMWRREAFGVMERTPNLLYLLLSKRIGNSVKMCDPFYGNPLLPRNAALGATMIDQEEWDRDHPKLKAAGILLQARFTFASVEPMLGPIDARGELPDWVIVGGESGREARPMNPAWACSLRDQCQAAGRSFFFKQWGEWIGYVQAGGSGWRNATPQQASYKGPMLGVVSAPGDRELFGGHRLPSVVTYGRDATVFVRAGKKLAGRLLDGREWNEMPGGQRA